MRVLNWLLIFGIIVSFNAVSYSEDVEREKKTSSGGNEIVTGALMGGLLGGGVGAAIGSASGHAGTGALIGAGVGAAGGSVLGAAQADKKERQEAMEEPRPAPIKSTGPSKVKKRVIREYDAEGNVISEKQVSN